MSFQIALALQHVSTQLVLWFSPLIVAGHLLHCRFGLGFMTLNREVVNLEPKLSEIFSSWAATAMCLGASCLGACTSSRIHPDWWLDWIDTCFCWKLTFCCNGSSSGFFSSFLPAVPTWSKGWPGLGQSRPSSCKRLGQMLSECLVWGLRSWKKLCLSSFKHMFVWIPAHCRFLCSKVRCILYCHKWFTLIVTLIHNAHLSTHVKTCRLAKVRCLQPEC